MFVLPTLPFNYIDLEPYVDTQTVYVHHRMHHQTYVNKLNDALTAQGIDKKPDMVTAMSSSTAAIKNNAGGHYNHSMFWHMLAKPASGHEGPVGTLKGELENSFGSVDEFKRLFSEAAATQFGSGWAWLGVEAGPEKKLAICTTGNQDNPIVKGHSTKQVIPFMTIDVWEHAYYLKYQNRRVEYISQFWKVANWERIEQLYDQYASKGIPVPLLE